MTTIGPMTAAAQPAATLAAVSSAAAQETSGLPQRSDGELREVFTQFVGQTFFGQMLKAMRSTVGKPAYFHGGQAEEIFRGQLDQTLAEHMTEASADRFATPLFDRQFPHLAAEQQQSGQPGLDQLNQLSRR